MSVILCDVPGCNNWSVVWDNGKEPKCAEHEHLLRRRVEDAMPKTARERFVAGQQQMRTIVSYFYKMSANETLCNLFDDGQRQAVEAFADLMSHYAPGALTPNELIEGPEFTRASLLKACGL